MDSGQVLIISPYFKPSIGGIENHVYELAKRLSKHCNVEILTTGTSFQSARIGERVSIRSFRPIINPMNNPMVPSLLYHAAKSKSSIIHVHGLYQITMVLAYIAARISGKPIIVTMHGKPHYNSRCGILVQRIYESSILKLILKRCDGIIALTTNDISFLLGFGVKKTKLSLIPNATDTSFWTPNKKAKNKPKPHSRRFLLFVGALIERKDCEIVLHAFRNLVDILQDIDLIIVGKGPCKNRLEEKSERMGINERVIFKQGISRDDLLSLYTNAEVVIHPSRMEGLPTVILEAMAAGALVISSDIDAVKGLVEEGENGFLFSVGKVESLVYAIQKVLSLPIENKMQIRRTARTTILDGYSWNVTAREIVQLYLKMTS